MGDFFRSASSGGLIQRAEEEAGGRAVLEQEYPLLSQLLSQEPRAEAFQVTLGPRRLLRRSFTRSMAFTICVALG